MSRADIAAGKAFVTLFVKKDQFTRGLQQAKASMNQFGADMTALGARIIAMSGAIAAPLGFATRAFAEFDDAMRAVGAVTQSTEAQLASMTEVAKELGRTTSFTAVEVAKLMTELGRAGFKPDQVNAMTGAVLNLARATGTDATLSSGIMAATIRQFNLEATDAARVADVLTMAANATFNSVEGLGESLKYAGPVAKELGLSLEDTAAILGTLGNVGIQGSEAGTALRRLGVISAATGKDLKRIFDISNVDASGQLKPLVQIMGEIGSSIENLPMAERVSKMNDAFGLLGITSASVLSRTAGDTEALAAALKNAEGTAAKAAAGMDAGLGGSFRIILSAVEGLQLAIGKALSGSLKTMTDSMTTAIGKATEWVGRNEGLIVSIAAMTAGAAAAGVAILSIGLAAKATAVALSVMATGFGVVKSVMMAAVVATKLFAAASMAASWAIYGVTVAAVLLSQGASVSAAAAGVMSAAWAAAGGVISSVWAVITAPAFPFIAAGTAAVAVVGSIAAAAAYATARGMDFSGAWATVVGTLTELMDVAKRVGSVLMDALAGGDYDIAMAVAFQGIKLALATAIDGMASMWTQFWEGAWEAAEKFMTEFARLSLKVVSSVATAIANPTAGAAQLATTLYGIAKKPLSISIDTAAWRTDANAEIDRLEKELEARKAKREAEQKANADADAAAAGGTVPGAAGTGGDGIPVGDAMAADMDAEVVASDETTKAFDRETAALEQQIIALREGADAAERFRLAKEGLSAEQIDAVMASRAEIEALEKQQEIAKRNVGKIQDYANAEYEKGKLSPEEIAAKEKADIEKARQMGYIDNATAVTATAEADKRMSDRIHEQKLKEFKGEGGGEKGSEFDIKSGGASAASFNLMEVSQTAAGGQIKATMDVKKAIEKLMGQQKEEAVAMLTALRSGGLIAT